MLRLASRAVRSPRVAQLVRYNSSKVQDERMIGDYPNVPFQYQQHKNPSIKYDDQQGRRNFNEPLHANFEYTDVWSPDRFDFVSDSYALRSLGYCIAAFATFGTAIYLFVDHESPAIKRTYPHDGLYKALGGTDETKNEYQARPDQS